GVAREWRSLAGGGSYQVFNSGRWEGSAGETASAPSPTAGVNRQAGPPETVTTGRPSRSFAWLVVSLGWLVVPAICVAAFLAWHSLPGISSLPQSGVNALLPGGTAAARVEQEASKIFGSALLPRIVVVQRNPKGLTGE